MKTRRGRGARLWDIGSRTRRHVTVVVVVLAVVVMMRVFRN